MSLAVESRRLGDVILISCTGRIVEGDESAALRELVESALPHDPYFVFDLSAVDSIDSGGLGLLVRLLSRAQSAGGDLKLCALPPRVSEILRITRLQTIFDTHPSPEDAVAAFYRGVSTATHADRLKTDILCVASSRDVIAYVREVLGQAGHGVMTSDNLPDAVMLLRATRPKLIVIDADLRTAQNTPAADVFNGIAKGYPVIELPLDFSHRDAGEAARLLVEQVRSAL